MKYTRLYTGNDEQSYFEELSMDLVDAKYGKLTQPFDIKNASFGRIVDADVEVDWHNPPCPQYVIMLKGAMEIETGDGTKRIFGEGDILLAEDTTGQGHITRAGSKEIREYLMLPLKSKQT